MDMEKYAQESNQNVVSASYKNITIKTRQTLRNNV